MTPYTHILLSSGKAYAVAMPMHEKESKEAIANKVEFEDQGRVKAYLIAYYTFTIITEHHPYPITEGYRIEVVDQPAEIYGENVWTNKVAKLIKA